MEKAPNKFDAELSRIAETIRERFGSLSATEINWKPDAESWSIGQCLEHLIKSNELYFDDFELIANGTYQNSFYENYSPLSGFFGKFIANALKKDSQKTKTIPAAVPPSEIDSRIVEKFAANQEELKNKIDHFDETDWRKVKLTSPFLKIATYNLEAAVQIIIEHERRHVRQAERVFSQGDFTEAVEK